MKPEAPRAIPATNSALGSLSSVALSSGWSVRSVLKIEKIMAKPVQNSPKNPLDPGSALIDDR
jgi:hypothetical protein